MVQTELYSVELCVGSDRVELSTLWATGQGGIVGLNRI